MSACRDCGEPIAWVRLRKQNGQTSNPVPVNTTIDGDIALTEDGTLRDSGEKAYGLPLLLWQTPGPGLVGARNHFDTCTVKAARRRR